MGFTAYNSADPYGGFCFKTGFYSRLLRGFPCFAFQMQSQEERKYISEKIHCCGTSFLLFCYSCILLPSFAKLWNTQAKKGREHLFLLSSTIYFRELLIWINFPGATIALQKSVISLHCLCGTEWRESHPMVGYSWWLLFSRDTAQPKSKQTLAWVLVLCLKVTSLSFV